MGDGCGTATTGCDGQRIAALLVLITLLAAIVTTALGAAILRATILATTCLLYTSDAADE